MLTIKFFSLIREALDTEQMSLDWSQDVATVAQLKQSLIAEGGEHWSEVLNQPNLVQALNQRVVFEDAAVADGDEVAFFPPMTGG